MATSAVVNDWALFVGRCLQQRTSPNKFESLARVLAARCRPSGAKLTTTIIDTQLRGFLSADPLVTAYIEKSLDLFLISVPELLSALLRTSQYNETSNQIGALVPEGSERLRKNPVELEESVFRLVRRTFIDGSRPRTVNEALKTLGLVAQWMEGFVADSNHSAMMHDLANPIPEIPPEVLLLREAFGQLILSLLQNSKVVGILDRVLPKDVGQKLGSSLIPFIQLLAASSFQIAQGLNQIQKSHAVLQIGPQDAIAGQGGTDTDVANLQLGSVLDLPSINSRAGLYIYLQAILVGRPLTNDLSILNYVHARYKGDSQSSVTDLITAAFDSVINSQYRAESANSMFLLRSFIANKMPLILSALLAPSFNSFSMALCIEQAFHRIDPASAYPQNFGMNQDNDLLSTIRQEFLSAAALHHLVTEDDITGILGGPSSRPRPANRKSKEAWIAQYTSDPQKIESMITAMETLDGNAGAVVLAVSENLCTLKDTFSLRTICVSLSRKPHALDALALFVEPMTFMQPLCNILDEWKFDEDQGEYQPSYDEFGAIILFVAAFAYRFGLSSSDISMADQNGFTARYLDRALSNQPLENLTSEQKKGLEGWIRALFETESIGDDVMSACRPQDFYLLVPTLFSQCIAACSAKYMTMETLKTGLELLLETSLLPAMIGALIWLMNRMWEARSDNDILLQVVQKLVTPSTLKTEAVHVHGVVLSIIGRDLDQVLKDVQRFENPKQNMKPILDKIGIYLDFQRASNGHHDELLSTDGLRASGMLNGIKTTIQSLVMWSLGTSLPAYTHRQLLVAIRLFGALNVLRAIVDEVKTQTEAQSGSLAIDVATALICAPSSADRAIPNSSEASQSPQYSNSRLGLREALQLELDDASKFILTDPLRAESLVRLSRRVEAQSVEIPTTDLQMAMPVMIQDIGLPGAEELNAISNDAPLSGGIDFMNADSGLHIDTSGDALNLRTAAQTLDSANVIASAEEDIFAGLGLDTDMDDLDFS